MCARSPCANREKAVKIASGEVIFHCHLFKNSNWKILQRKNERKISCVINLNMLFKRVFPTILWCTSICVCVCGWTTKNSLLLLIFFYITRFLFCCYFFYLFSCLAESNLQLHFQNCCTSFQRSLSVFLVPVSL